MAKYMNPKDLLENSTISPASPIGTPSESQAVPNEVKPMQFNGQSARPKLSLNPDRYIQVSIRYAIADILSQLKNATLTELCEYLLAGGVRSSARDFRKTVNTVLATMCRKKEVDSPMRNIFAITKEGESLLYFPATKPKKILERTTARIQNYREIPRPKESLLKSLRNNSSKFEKSTEVEELTTDEILRKIAKGE